MNKTVIVSLALVLFAAGAITLVTAATMARRQAPEPVQVETLLEEPVALATQEWLTEYTLTERDGKPFHSRDLDGTVHVVNFFFASCPSYCRMQTMEVQKLAREFGPQGVKFLSITCDPENDSPEALRSYAELFNADEEDWLFLTGDLLLLRRIGSEMYQVMVDKQLHTEHLIVVDKWGKIRGQFKWKDDPKELATMKESLEELLVETEPPPEPEPAPAVQLEEDEDV